MITTILRTATAKQILAARHYAADHLHIAFLDVTKVVAVAYVNKHFEQGTYENWDGFVEMLEADEKTNAPGYGQGVDSTVHRTQENGDSFCGDEVTTLGDADSASDLIRNHGYSRCMVCDYAIGMRKLHR